MHMNNRKLYNYYSHISVFNLQQCTLVFGEHSYFKPPELDLPMVVPEYYCIRVGRLNFQVP